ncbi:hypothetical protein KJ765_05740 [Candidatus Micrarchaeota archaeon]|nr:hypothetical protein [Candidatus Micrarchaeota archaeon]
MSRSLGFLSFACLVLFSYSVSAGTISTLDYSPSNYTVGALETITVHFKAAELHNLSFVTVIFADEFILSTPVTLGPISGLNNFLPDPTIVGQKVIVNLSSPEPLDPVTDVFIDFQSVINPTAAQGYFVEIQTGNYTSGFEVLDSGITSPVTFIADDMVSVNLTSSSALTQSVGSRFTLTLTGWDQYGNPNTAGGFNWVANSSVVSYVSGNATQTGTFDAVSSGAALITGKPVLNPALSNSTVVMVLPDTTAPVLSIKSPSVIWYPNATVLLNVSSTEILSSIVLEISNATGLVMRYVNASFANSSGIYYSKSADLSASGSGNYSFVFYGNDSHSNQGTASGSFAIDAVVPDANNFSVALTPVEAITSDTNVSTYRGAHVFLYANVSESYPNLFAYIATIKYSNGTVASTLSPATQVNSLVYKWVWETNTTTPANNYTVDFSFTDLLGHVSTETNALQIELRDLIGDVTLTLSTYAICSGDSITISGTAAAGSAYLGSKTILFSGAAVGSTITAVDGSYSSSQAFSGTGTATVTVRVQYTNIQNSRDFNFVSDCSSSSTATPTPLPSTIPTPTPTPTSVPTSTPVPTVSVSVLERTLSDQSTVRAVFESNSATFTLVFKAPEGGFEGDLEFAFPFNYDDYLNGLIGFDPEPSLVERGSVIAIWNDLSLASTEEFSVFVEVLTPMEASVLDAFPAPNLRLKSDASPSAEPVSAFDEDVAAFTASGGMNFLLVMVIVVILVGGVFAYGKLAGKRITPENIQKPQPPKQPLQQSGTSATPKDSIKPLNLPPWWQKKQEKQSRLDKT